MRNDSCFDTIWTQLYEPQRDFIYAVEKKINALIERYKLDPPVFSLGWDQNETGADLIRVAVPKDSGGATAEVAEATAYHVFAHWLCNLEQTHDGDKVAYIIADLLKKADR